MNIKIEDVVSFGNVLRALFRANYSGVVVLDADFKDTWTADVFDVQKQAVEDMVGTPGLRKQMKGDIEKRNKLMDSEIPLTAVLGYAVDKCIVAGTLSGNKGSFGIAAFNKSISDRNIGLFNTSYAVTYTAINKDSNATALDSKGFTTAMQGNFKDAYTNAWKLNNNCIDTSQDINTLSGDDKILVDTFMATCMLLIAAIRTYAKSISDKELAKRATFAGIKKSVEPSKDKKARNLSIKEFASRVVAGKVPAKYKMQFTLMTKGVTVMVCRQVLKTGVCTVGTPLVYNEMLEVVKGDLPGTGEKIVVTNTSGKKVVVKYLKIAVA